MTLVVKLGGAQSIDSAATVADVADLVASGEHVVVVHGGSTAIDETLEALGLDPEYVTTPDGITGRFTDAATMTAVTMTLAGRVNVNLTVDLQNAGVDAVGLAGVDGGLVTGPRKSAVRIVEGGKQKVRRGDHAGRIETVNDSLLELLLDAGYVPVVSLPMLSDDGVAVNTDADRLAATVAGRLGATLVLLTDVAGVYADVGDPDSRIDRIDDADAVSNAIAAASGFMTRKVMAAIEALETGAEAVYIADATAATPVHSARAGDATEFTLGAVAEGDDP